MKVTRKMLKAVAKTAAAYQRVIETGRVAEWRLVQHERRLCHTLPAGMECPARCPLARPGPRSPRCDAVPSYRKVALMWLGVEPYRPATIRHRLRWLIRRSGQHGVRVPITERVVTVQQCGRTESAKV